MLGWLQDRLRFVVGMGRAESSRHDLSDGLDWKRSLRAGAKLVKKLLAISALLASVLVSGFWHGVGGVSYLSAPMMIGQSSGNPSTSAINYIFPGNNNTGTWTATSSLRASPIAATGTLSNFQVLLGTAPGAGAGWSYNVCNLTTSTCTLTCDVSGASATTCSDTSNSLAVTAGDMVAVRSCPYNTLGCTAGTAPTASATRMSYEFTSTVGSEAPIFWGGEASISTAGYYGVGANVRDTNALPNSAETVAPTAGTIDRLYAYCTAGLTSGKSWTFTLYKNSSPTNLSVIISNACAVQSDLDAGHAVGVNAGDTLAIYANPASSPTAGVLFGSVRWLPTTANEYPLFSAAGILPATGTRYMSISGSTTTGSGTESLDQMVIPAGLHVTKSYISIDTAPGVGTSRLYDLRSNAGASGWTQQSIADTATTSTGSGSVAYTAGPTNTIDWRQTVSGSPAGLTAWAHLSLVVTIP